MMSDVEGLRRETENELWSIRRMCEDNQQEIYSLQRELRSVWDELAKLDMRFRETQVG